MYLEKNMWRIELAIYTDSLIYSYIMSRVFDSKNYRSAYKYVLYVVIFLLVTIFLVAGSFFYVLGIYALYLYCKNNAVKTTIPKMLLDKMSGK